MTKAKAKKPKTKKAVATGGARSGVGASEFGPLVGRASELRKLRACLHANRSILLEGPVGVGKTHLALAITRELGRPVFRIDGDSRYTEQKLSGWFDPPAVMKQGFVAKAFIPGPLVEAMRAGGVLFINELNRLPEGVQNILLPALDERRIQVPRLGTIEAKPGFLVIATQNPKEFVATSHLSEAILDRFELILMDYQSEEEERAIVLGKIDASPANPAGSDLSRIAYASVRLTRFTRNHPRIRRGASIRGAIAIAELTLSFLLDEVPFAEAFRHAVHMALPTRIEIERDSESESSHQDEVFRLLDELTESALSGDASVSVEKKSPNEASRASR